MSDIPRFTMELAASAIERISSFGITLLFTLAINAPSKLFTLTWLNKRCSSILLQAAENLGTGEWDTTSAIPMLLPIDDNVWILFSSDSIKTIIFWSGKASNIDRTVLVEKDTLLT